VNQRFLRQINK